MSVHVSVCLCMCLYVCACVCVSVCLCVCLSVWYYGLADYDASPPMCLHANYQNWISTSAVCLFCLMGRKPGMKHPRVIKEYNLLFTLSLIHGTHFCAHHHFHQIRFSDLRLERHFQLTNISRVARKTGQREPRGQFSDLPHISQLGEGEGTLTSSHTGKITLNLKNRLWSLSPVVERGAKN